MEGNKAEGKTMDSVPGGETPQYESIKTENVPASKQRGQLGAGSNTSETASMAEERGQKKAGNMRCSHNIFESGMGGKTNSQIGEPGQQAGYGGVPDQSKDQDTRSQQRYGEGSGIGA